MNAYPAELVQHHYACMLVAGLTGPPPGPSSSPSSQPSSSGQPPSSVPPSQSQPSEGQTQAAQASTSSSAVGVSDGGGAAPTSPKDTRTALNPTATTATLLTTPGPTQVFPQLCKELCEVFDARGRSTAWDPARGQSAVFHAVLVDSNVRLPPRKTRPVPRTLSSASPEQQSIINDLQPRSPLSPLHPSSPLFPDGLVAPIWMRKHRELVPAVFVAFHCLAEPPPPPLPRKDRKTSLSEESKENDTGEAEARNAEQETKEREEAEEDEKAAMARAGQELKKRDEELIKQIADRKRTLSERGIKLTIVLLTTRTMLESPTLESRLSYIRRSSMLDSRASLFVLTPVSKSELNEFVTSLQSALYDAALDYYREHMRRARRKRARYPPASSLVSHIMTAAAQLRNNNAPIRDPPLSRDGWLVRNDVKLATFAELSGNLAEALQHYETAYHSLSTQLLTSTLLLPPRTKRWAEAKVLADTLSVRISKLYLYANEGEAAWRQFRLHIKHFTELSQGWGIGEMTFEYWSWLGKQYRLMGDLLDLATRPIPGSPLPAFEVVQHHPPLPPFLLHPSHLPTPTASGQQYPQTYNPQHGPLLPPNAAAMQSGATPAAMCPGPAECFYFAGLCALERWSRFRRLSLQQEQRQRTSAAADTPQGGATGGGGGEDDGQSFVLVQEKKVDHAAQVIDVFTRAYELFKRMGKVRLSLSVASKIAHAYLQSGQHEMALRFLERIVKTYRVEGWEAPLDSLLLQSFECATQVGDADSQGRALWELSRPSAASLLTPEQREQVSDELQQWWRQRITSKGSGVPIEVVAEAVDGILGVEFVFLKPGIHLGIEPAVFQLRFSCPEESLLPSSIAFEGVRIYFESGQGPEEEEAYVVIPAEVEAKKEPVSHIANVGILSLDQQQQQQHGGEGEEQKPSTMSKVALRWQKNVTTTIQGALRAERPRTLRISKVMLASSAVNLVFNLPAEDEAPLMQPFEPRWMVRNAGAQPPRLIELGHRQEEAHVIHISRRKHKLRIEMIHEEYAYRDEELAVTIRVHNDEEETPHSDAEERAVDCSVDVTLQTGEAMLACDDQESIAMLQGLSFGKVQRGSMAEKTFRVRVTQPAALEVIVRAASSIAASGPYAAETHSSEFLHHISLGLRQALSCQFTASWTAGEAKPRPIARSPSLNNGSAHETNGGLLAATMARTKSSDSLEEMGRGGEEADGASSIGMQLDQNVPNSTIAAVYACLNVIAPTPLVIETVRLALDPANRSLRLVDSTTATQGTEGEVETSPDTRQVGGEWIQDDRWGTVFDVEVTSAEVASHTGDANEEPETVGPTGYLEVRWRRSTSNDVNALTTTRLTLPLLVPPHHLARLVVSATPVASIESPLVVLLTLINPSRRAAVDVFVALDEHAESAFHLLGGPRSFTVPNLLPRSTRSVPVQIYAKRDGLQYLPRIRAWQKERKAQGAQAVNNGGGLQQQQQQQQQGIINETQGGGVPLEVRFRHGTGAASLSAAGQKALAQLHLAQRAQSQQQQQQEESIATKRMSHDRHYSALAILVQGHGQVGGA